MLKEGKKTQHRLSVGSMKIIIKFVDTVILNRNEANY